MSEQLILIIASSVFSIIGYFLLERYKQKSLPYGTNKEVLREQLKYVYEPLYVKLCVRSEDDISALKIAINNIISNCFYLVPINLAEAFSEICRNDCTTPEQLSDIQLIVTSNYNWAKMKLGYPYDKRQIDETKLPFYSRKRNRMEYVLIFVDVIRYMELFVGIPVIVVRAVEDGNIMSTHWLTLLFLATLFNCIFYFFQFCLFIETKNENKKD